MRCFYHRDKEAVGVCKNCHKGLCPECASDVGNGIACRGDCETKVQELNGMMARNKELNAQSDQLFARSQTMYRQSGRRMLAAAIVSLLVGGTFVGFGCYLDSNPFMITLGGIFLVASAMQYAGARNIAKNC